MSDTDLPGPGQIRPDNQSRSIGAGDLLYDPALFLLAAQLDGIEELRKATENRHRQAIRCEPDADGELRGMCLPEDDPGVKSVRAVLDGLAALEHRTVLDLQRAMRRHPLGVWQRAQIGVGEKQLARLLSAIGDPYWHVAENRPRTVSELWAYCGLHTLPVISQCFSDTHGSPIDNGNQLPATDQSLSGAHAPGVDGGEVEPAPDHYPLNAQIMSIRGAARRKKGQRANWSTVAKSRAYLIAESCVKQARSPYREVYDKRRAVTAERVHDRACSQCDGAGSTELGTPWRPGHQHADALRIVSKTVLKDLWCAARDWYRNQEEGGS